MGEGSDPSAHRRLRRGILAGGLAGIVATVLGRARPAAAADGGAVILGEPQNVATTATGIVKVADPAARPEAALRVINTAGSAIVGIAQPTPGDEVSDIVFFGEGAHGAVFVAGPLADPTVLERGRRSGVRVAAGRPDTTGIQVISAGAAIVGSSGMIPSAASDANSDTAFFGEGQQGAVFVAGALTDPGLLQRGARAGVRVATTDAGVRGIRVISKAGAAIVGSSGDPSALSDATSDMAFYGEGPTGAVFVAGPLNDQALVLDGRRAGVRVVSMDPAAPGLDIYAGGGTAVRVRSGKIELATERSATFPTGTTRFLVQDPNVTTESHVIATFKADPGQSSFKWFELLAGVGFIAYLDHKLPAATNFSYVIIEPAR